MHDGSYLLGMSLAEVSCSFRQFLLKYRRTLIDVSGVLTQTMTRKNSTKIYYTLKVEEPTKYLKYNAIF